MRKYLSARTRGQRVLTQNAIQAGDNDVGSISRNKRFFFLFLDGRTHSSGGELVGAAMADDNTSH